MSLSTKDAYQLFHEGSIAFAEMESNGIRIDVPYLDAAIHRTGNRIEFLTHKLQEDEIYGVWKRKFGQRTNLDSRQQLTEILFGVLRLPFPEGEEFLTSTGRYKSDESTLDKTNIPFAKKFAFLQRVKKAKNTFLEGIRREVVDGYIHPFFNLHTTRTFRSSSDSPNFQNLPIRDPHMGKLIRRAFIPRKGRCLVEVDFSGIEVRIAACYHKDPAMLEYINDPSKDMHRDMAMECYALNTEEWNSLDKANAKQLRYCGKSNFVFPQFYGSAWFQCAPALWSACDGMRLVGPEGKTIKQHLVSKGITKLGLCAPGAIPERNSYAAHIKSVEEDFWGRRFKVYQQWKNDWVEQYRKMGRFTSLTGFTEEGVFSRNDVINHPVQGSAFHCLLKSLVEVRKRIRDSKMQTCLVGQIHDSILADSPVEEVGDYLNIAREVMTVWLPKQWSWIITPLEIEAEVAESSWYEKKQYVEKNGEWTEG
jgi:DNA polymerase-1